jgi:hypothetical protein
MIERKEDNGEIERSGKGRRERERREREEGEREIVR